MSNKVIISNYKDKPCSFFIQNNRLIQMQVLASDSKIGSVYIGKIKNVLQNIKAYFVEIDNQEICFLPFSEATHAFCLNRKRAGRLVQGDEILVQVTKDALKTKQASLTCNITQNGAYFVFTVGNNTLGISNKLSKPVKNSIKETLETSGHLDHDGNLLYHAASEIPRFGVVVRTEAAKLYEESSQKFLDQFKAELHNFVSLLENSQFKSCFQCVYKPNLSYLERFTEYADNEYDEVITDLNEAYTALQGHSKPVRFYDDSKYPLSKLYSLETKVAEAFQKQVWLKSGSNIIIEQTECLTTIDVNSAKQIKKSSTKDDMLEINKEAAIEAARQIRLRNLSGIIIIDFINMDDSGAEEELINFMSDLVCRDKVPTSVIDITPLGLMEITRKKISKPLSEQLRG